MPQIHHAPMGRAWPVLWGQLTLLMTLLACSGTEDAGMDRMALVLANRDSVAVADGLPLDLRAQVVAKFLAVGMVMGEASPGDNIIGVTVNGTGPDPTAVYLIDPVTKKQQKVLQETKELSPYRIAIGPGKREIAVMTGGGILLYDLWERQAKGVLRVRAHWMLSWSPDGNRIAYDTQEGWVEAVALRTHTIERLVQGASPRWSPDGMKLAYLYHESVYVYDLAAKNSRRVYRQWPWRPPVYGGLYWSPDGRYLAFAAGWDLLGMTWPRCMVVEAASGRRVASLGLGDFNYCGPWLLKAP